MFKMFYCDCQKLKIKVRQYYNNQHFLTLVFFYDTCGELCIIFLIQYIFVKLRKKVLSLSHYNSLNYELI